MNTEPEPLHSLEKGSRLELSERGDDTRANTEYACFPQNETTIVFNPKDSDNIVSAQNDYRMGGSSGINASTDGGKHWYDLIGPFPSLPNGETLDSAGDPALAFDREGALLREHRLQSDRRHERHLGHPLDERRFHLEPGCVRRPHRHRPAAAGPAIHASRATAVVQPENEQAAAGAGELQRHVPRQGIHRGRSAPRRRGTALLSPETKTPRPWSPGSHIGPGRVFVTWTAFNNPTGAPFAIVSATIEVSYSDDRGRSWSPRRTSAAARPSAPAYRADGV